MHKRNINIILITGFIVIWLLVAYRIFSFTTDQQPYIFNSQKLKTSPVSNSYGDTVILYANYRDPFLQTGIKPVSMQENSLPEIKPKQMQIIVKPTWPKIVYNGLVKNTNGGKELALITITDRTIIAEKDFETNGIKILAIYHDSIKVQLLNEKKIVIKK